MKILIMLFCLIVLVVSISGQENQKSYPQITWTSKPECELFKFTDEQLAKTKISCDQFVLNGETVYVIKYGDIAICASMGIDSGYMVTDLYVANNTPERFLVDPDRTRIFVYKDPKIKEPEIYAYVPPNKIVEKIQRRIAWANALSTFGAAMQTRTTTVNTTSNGTVSATDNRGTIANGTYSGNSTSTATTQDQEAARRAAAQNNQRNAQASQTGNSIISTALFANTVFPSTSTNGLIYFKLKKAYLGYFTINMAEVNFGFPFKYDGKK